MTTFSAYKEKVKGGVQKTEKESLESESLSEELRNYENLHYDGKCNLDFSIVLLCNRWKVELSLDGASQLNRSFKHFMLSNLIPSTEMSFSSCWVLDTKSEYVFRKWVESRLKWREII